MRLIFEQIRTGGDRNFGYLLADGDEKDGVLIDPSYSPEALVERARDQDITITHIINTHGHPDHINGNDKAAELTGAPVAGHPQLTAPSGQKLIDRQELSVGALRLNFFHTPGHSGDHLVVHEPTHGILITGDLLFVGKVGGTQNDDDSRIEWESLHWLLREIPDACTVWPGHDYGARPSSTIGMERRSNPFLLCPDLDSFLQLKKNWPDFKKRHGLK